MFFIKDHEGEGYWINPDHIVFAYMTPFGSVAITTSTGVEIVTSRDEWQFYVSGQAINLT